MEHAPRWSEEQAERALLAAEGTRSTDQNGATGHAALMERAAALRARQPEAVDAAEKLVLKLDLSFGDPVEPQRIEYPTLLGDQGFSLLGYPLESVIAEKADTMMFLAATRTPATATTATSICSRRFILSGPRFCEARSAAPPSTAVTRCVRSDHFSKPCARRQQPWEAFRARVGLPGLPERFADVVDVVVAFIDGLQSTRGSTWNPATRKWEQGGSAAGR